MKYPSAVNLPFNGEIIKDRFTLARPGDGLGGGPGYWIIIQGNAMVVKEEQGAIFLHEGTLPSWLEAKSEHSASAPGRTAPSMELSPGKIKFSLHHMLPNRSMRRKMIAWTNLF